MNGSQVSDRLMCSCRRHRKHDILAARQHAETIDVNICHLMAEMHTGLRKYSEQRLGSGLTSIHLKRHTDCVSVGCKGIFQRTTVGEYSCCYFSANL